MHERSQTVFYIERMQPDWLTRRRWLYRILVGLVVGLVVGLAVGLVSALSIAIIIDLIVGGTAVIQHSALRLILTLNNHAPLNYVRFLDHAAERILLRKVGGGYIFVHRMLLEYFASREEEKA
jgi:large-conductance mechanosensitive channel